MDKTIKLVGMTMILLVFTLMKAKSLLLTTKAQTLYEQSILIKSY
ncbi:hypothetical protein [Chryseobacterium paludis]|nr:hypothetical protein [Chryseobacterium paludis]